MSSCWFPETSIAHLQLRDTFVSSSGSLGLEKELPSRGMGFAVLVVRGFLSWERLLRTNSLVMSGFVSDEGLSIANSLLAMVCLVGDVFVVSRQRSGDGRGFDVMVLDFWKGDISVA